MLGENEVPRSATQQSFDLSPPVDPRSRKPPYGSDHLAIRGDEPRQSLPQGQTPQPTLDYRFWRRYEPANNSYILGSPGIQGSSRTGSASGRAPITSRNPDMAGGPQPSASQSATGAPANGSTGISAKHSAKKASPQAPTFRTSEMRNKSFNTAPTLAELSPHSTGLNTSNQHAYSIPSLGFQQAPGNAPTKAGEYPRHTEYREARILAEGPQPPAGNKQAAPSHRAGPGRRRPPKQDQSFVTAANPALPKQEARKELQQGPGQAINQAPSHPTSAFLQTSKPHPSAPQQITAQMAHAAVPNPSNASRTSMMPNGGSFGRAQNVGAASRPATTSSMSPKPPSLTSNGAPQDFMNSVRDPASRGHAGFVASIPSGTGKLSGGSNGAYLPIQMPGRPVTSQTPSPSRYDAHISGPGPTAGSKASSTNYKQPEDAYRSPTSVRSTQRTSTRSPNQATAGQAHHGTQQQAAPPTRCMPRVPQEPANGTVDKTGTNAPHSAKPEQITSRSSGNPTQRSAELSNHKSPYQLKQPVPKPPDSTRSGERTGEGLQQGTKVKSDKKKGEEGDESSSKKSKLKGERSSDIRKSQEAHPRKNKDKTDKKKKKKKDGDKDPAGGEKKREKRDDKKKKSGKKSKKKQAAALGAAAGLAGTTGYFAYEYYESGNDPRYMEISDDESASEDDTNTDTESDSDMESDTDSGSDSGSETGLDVSETSQWSAGSDVPSETLSEPAFKDEGEMSETQYESFQYGNDSNDGTIVDSQDDFGLPPGASYRNQSPSSLSPWPAQDNTDHNNTSDGDSVPGAETSAYNGGAWEPWHNSGYNDQPSYSNHYNYPGDGDLENQAGGERRYEPSSATEAYPQSLQDDDHHDWSTDRQFYTNQHYNYPQHEAYGDRGYQQSYGQEHLESQRQQHEHPIEQRHYGDCQQGYYETQYQHAQPQQYYQSDPDGQSDSNSNDDSDSDPDSNFDDEIGSQPANDYQYEQEYQQQYQQQYYEPAGQYNGDGWGDASENDSDNSEEEDTDNSESDGGEEEYTDNGESDGGEEQDADNSESDGEEEEEYQEADSDYEGGYFDDGGDDSDNDGYY